MYSLTLTIMLLFFEPYWGKILYEILQTLRIMERYRTLFLQGFINFIEKHDIDHHHINKSESYFVSNLKYLSKIHFSQIKFVTSILHNLVPETTIENIVEYCCISKTVNILYYIFSKYERILLLEQGEHVDPKNIEYYDYKNNCLILKAITRITCIHDGL